LDVWKYFNHPIILKYQEIRDTEIKLAHYIAILKMNINSIPTALILLKNHLRYW